MKKLAYIITQRTGIIFLSTVLLLQACGTDGKKESRTEEAIEKTGDTTSANAREVQARAKKKLREADEYLTAKSKDVGAGLRHDANVVVANMKARAQELHAKEKIQETDEKLMAGSRKAAAGFRHDRDVVIANIRARTRELDAKIKALHAEEERKNRGTGADTDVQIDKLKNERDDLNSDLNKAQNATADAWQSVKKGFKRAGNKVGDALNRTGDKLKND